MIQIEFGQSEGELTAEMSTLTMGVSRSIGVLVEQVNRAAEDHFLGVAELDAAHEGAQRREQGEPGR